jgi:hypothetical protein
LKDANHLTNFQLFSDTYFFFKDLLSNFRIVQKKKTIIIIFINRSFNYFSFQTILVIENYVKFLFCDCQLTKIFNYYKRKFKIKWIQKNNKKNADKKILPPKRFEPKPIAWKYNHLPLIYWPHSWLKVSWLYKPSVTNIMTNILRRILVWWLCKMFVLQLSIN